VAARFLGPYLGESKAAYTPSRRFPNTRHHQWRSKGYPIGSLCGLDIDYQPLDSLPFRVSEARYVDPGFILFLVSRFILPLFLELSILINPGASVLYTVSYFLTPPCCMLKFTSLAINFLIPCSPSANLKSVCSKHIY
jgi:hypothetical protein